MIHIDIPTLAEFKALAAVMDDPCLSLYLPTSPLRSTRHTNRLAFKDVAKATRGRF
jgi:hypothetical protein